MIFSDKCNDCGATLEIDMDTMTIHRETCACDSDIKRAVATTQNMERETKRMTQEFMAPAYKTLARMEADKRRGFWGWLFG